MRVTECYSKNRIVLDWSVYVICTSHVISAEKFCITRMVGRTLFFALIALHEMVLKIVEMLGNQLKKK